MTKANVTNVTIRPEEAAHFSSLAREWWNAKGPMASLHQVNPVRLAFLREAIDRLNEVTASSIAPPIQTAIDTGMQAVEKAVREVASGQSEATQNGKAIGIQALTTLARVERLLDAAMGLGGIRVYSDSERPVGVTITNTFANPVPTVTND